VKSPSGQPPLGTHYVFLCVRSCMTPHSTLSAISGRKRHLWGGRVCQRSDHVDWFWLGHVRSISLREWENVLGGMEGCGVIYTSGPWSACNGSSETTGFPMHSRTVDGGSICSSWRPPDLSIWRYQKLCLKNNIKANIKSKWTLSIVEICTLEIGFHNLTNSQWIKSNPSFFFSLSLNILFYKRE